MNNCKRNPNSPQCCKMRCKDYEQCIKDNEQKNKELKDYFDKLKSISISSKATPTRKRGSK